MGMTPEKRAKLARILELLGSPHDGERLAAAAAAHRLVQSWGMRWDQVLGVGGVMPAAMPNPYAASDFGPPPRYSYGPVSGVWKAALCSQSPRLFTAGELAFLRGIMDRGHCLKKERGVLDALYERMRPGRHAA